MSEQMERWQALVDNATPGPWEVETREGGYPGSTSYITGHVRAKAHTYSGGAGKSDSVTSQPTMTSADAAFIAEARTAVPALLQVCREQLARVRELEVALGHYANPENWRGGYAGIGNVFAANGVHSDGSAVARAALNPAVQPGPPGMQFPATCARCGRHAAMPAGDNVCGSCGDDLRQEDMAESAALAQPSATEGEW